MKALDGKKYVCLLVCCLLHLFWPLVVVGGFVLVWCFWSALPVVLLFLCAVPGVSLLR